MSGKHLDFTLIDEYGRSIDQREYSHSFNSEILSPYSRESFCLTVLVGPIYGASPTLDISLESSCDSGTTWSRVIPGLPTGRTDLAWGNGWLPQIYNPGVFSKTWRPLGVPPDGVGLIRVAFVLSGENPSIQLRAVGSLW